MMKLEIRNLQTTTTHEILAIGATLGREGGDAEIRVTDGGVSKKHARIYARRGIWYLEDLKSANGTYLAEQRITEPTQLSHGAVFSISRAKFEVVNLIEEPDETTLSQPSPEGPKSPRAPTTDILALATAEKKPLTNGKSGPLARLEETVQPPKSRDVEALPTEIGGILPELLDAEKAFAGPPPEETTPGLPLPAEAKAPDTSPHVAAVEAPAMTDSGPRDDQTRPEIGRPRTSPGIDSQPESGTLSEPTPAPQRTAEDVEPPHMPSAAQELAGAFKEALRFYAQELPRMALHPLQELHDLEDESPLPALEPAQLIGYALPVGLFWSLISFLASLTVALATHSVSPSALIPIAPLASTIIGAALSGFLFHPVLRWLVDKLHGQSTAKSRSNFFGALNATMLLGAIPSGLAILCSAGHLPFLGVIPALLSIMTVALTAYAVYLGFRGFNVIETFQYAVVGIGVLSCLLAALGFVSTLAASLRGTQAIPAEPIAIAQPATPTPKQREAASRGVPKSTVTSLEMPPPPKLAAAENGKPSEPDKIVPAQGPSAATPQVGATPIAARSEAEPSRPMAQPAVATATVSEKIVPASTQQAVATAGSSPLSFDEFQSRRQEIERTIKANPMLLKRVPGLLPLYEKLHRATYEIDRKFAAASRRAHPSQVDVAQRLHEADLFEATSDLVNQVYAKLPR